MKGTWGSTVEEVDAYLRVRKEVMGQRTLQIDSAGSEPPSVLLDTSVFI